jgi:hypothetical protein
LSKKIKDANDAQDGINLKRKMSQEAIVEELIKNKFQRQDIMYKCWQIYAHCEMLDAQRPGSAQ